MHAIAVLLAFLSCPGQGLRVELVEGQAQSNLQARHTFSERVNDTVSSNVIQSNLRVGMEGPLKALAMLLVAFNPTAGWQASGYGGLGFAHPPEVGSTRVLIPKERLQRAFHSDVSYANPRAVWRHAGPSMAATSPMWDGNDDDFKVALSHLAPSKELPELRKEILDLDSQMSWAIGVQDFAEAARLRDKLRKLCSKDPAQISSSLRTRMQAAVKGNRFEEAARYRDQMRTLKGFQAEYQLAGTWKGNFPEQGDIFLRIGYDGDVLSAVTLNGDEIFNADVSDLVDTGNHTIVDGDKGMKVYEMKDKTIFAGMGKVSGGGFVAGQMYLMEDDDDAIAFLWYSGGGYIYDEGPERVLAAAGRDERRGGGGLTEDGDDFPSFVVFKRADNFIEFKNGRTVEFSTPIDSSSPSDLNKESNQQVVQAAALNKLFNLESNPDDTPESEKK